MDRNIKEQLRKFGFAEVAVENGMVDSNEYTGGCSGAVSDCCTRVCSQDKNLVSDNESWEKYLSIKGGQVQY